VVCRLKSLVDQVYCALGRVDYRVADFLVGNDPEIDARGAFTTIPVATIPFEIDFVGAEDQLVPSIKHFDF